jgi:hypothetical protein
MGGAGSGNWYRYDKKSTTKECRSLDVRRFRREGLRKRARRKPRASKDPERYACYRGVRRWTALRWTC